MFELQAAAVSPGERAQLRAAIRLAHFGPEHRLVAVCGDCRHARLLDMRALRLRLPPDVRAVSVEARLVCRACGNRKGNRLCLVHAEAVTEGAARRRQKRRPPDVIPIRSIVKQDARLRACCERPGCGHSAHLDPAELLRGWGEAVTVEEVRRMLRCSACGGRAVTVQNVAKVPDFDVSHAYRGLPRSTV